MGHGKDGENLKQIEIWPISLCVKEQILMLFFLRAESNACVDYALH